MKKACAMAQAFEYLVGRHRFELWTYGLRVVKTVIKSMYWHRQCSPRTAERRFFCHGEIFLWCPHVCIPLESTASDLWSDSFMRRINTFLLFQLGKMLRPIELLDEDNSIYGDHFIRLWDARTQVQGLLNNQELSVRTSRHAAQQLIEKINGVVPTTFQEAFNKDRTAKVDWWSIRQVKDAALKFETILAEELNLIDTYSIAQKGAYSTPELISNAEVMFSPLVQSKLPSLAVQDIREAGKCLAFETPTAAAFHIVRAIESVLLSYFQKVLQRPSPPRMRNWGVYISSLRDSGKADNQILDLLTHIKDTYRNPVSHPEAVLSVEEVLVLLGVAVSAMTQIALKL